MPGPKPARAGMNATVAVRLVPEHGTQMPSPRQLIRIGSDVPLPD